MGRQNRVAHLAWDDDGGSNGGATRLGIGLDSRKKKADAQNPLAALAKQGAKKRNAGATSLGGGGGSKNRGAVGSVNRKKSGRSASRGPAKGNANKGRGKSKPQSVGPSRSKAKQIGKETKSAPRQKQKKAAVVGFGAKLSGEKSGNEQKKPADRRRDREKAKPTQAEGDDSGVNAISADRLMNMMALAHQGVALDSPPRQSARGAPPRDSARREIMDGPSLALDIHEPDYLDLPIRGAREENEKVESYSHRSNHYASPPSHFDHPSSSTHDRPLSASAKRAMEIERLAHKFEEPEAGYSPWGRPGGGAPMRDERGRVQTRRIPSPLPGQYSSSPYGSNLTSQRDDERMEKKRKQMDIRRMLDEQVEERRSRQGYRNELEHTPIRNNNQQYRGGDVSGIHSGTRGAVRVHSPPGGVSSIQFGSGNEERVSEKRQRQLEMRRALDEQVAANNHNRNHPRSRAPPSYNDGERDTYTTRGNDRGRGRGAAEERDGEYHNEGDNYTGGPTYPDVHRHVQERTRGGEGAGKRDSGGIHAHSSNAAVRVHSPPGGASSISFGAGGPTVSDKRRKQAEMRRMLDAQVEDRRSRQGYRDDDRDRGRNRDRDRQEDTRPVVRGTSPSHGGGYQNRDDGGPASIHTNERNAVKIHNPPGGASSISFGGDPAEDRRRKQLEMRRQLDEQIEERKRQKEQQDRGKPQNGRARGEERARDRRGAPSSSQMDRGSIHVNQRKAVRIHNPPGGASSIHFGGDGAYADPHASPSHYHQQGSRVEDDYDDDHRDRARKYLDNLPDSRDYPSHTQSARVPDDGWTPRQPSQPQRGQYDDYHELRSPQDRERDRKREELRRDLDEQVRERKEQREGANGLHLDVGSSSSGVGNNRGRQRDRQDEGDYPHQPHRPSHGNHEELDVNRSNQLGSSLFGGDRYGHRLTAAEKKRQQQAVLRAQMDEQRARKEAEKKKEEDAARQEEMRLARQNHELQVEANGRDWTQDRTAASVSPAASPTAAGGRRNMQHSGSNPILPEPFISPTNRGQVGKSPKHRVPLSPVRSSGGGGPQDDNRAAEITELSSMFEKLVEEQAKLKADLAAEREKRAELERETSDEIHSLQSKLEGGGAKQGHPEQKKRKGSNKRQVGAKGRRRGDSGGDSHPTAHGSRAPAANKNLPSLLERTANDDPADKLAIREERRRRVLEAKKKQDEERRLAKQKSANARTVPRKSKVQRGSKKSVAEIRNASPPPPVSGRGRSVDRGQREEREERSSDRERIQLKITRAESVTPPAVSHRYEETRGRNDSRNPSSLSYNPSSYSSSREPSRLSYAQTDEFTNLGGLSSFVQPEDLGLHQTQFVEDSTGDDVALNRHIVDDIMWAQAQSGL